MAEDKQSFVAYCDWIDTFEALPDDKAGQLAKHLFRYVNDKNPESDDILITAVFANIKQTLKRDLRKYDKIKAKRSEAGKASAEKRKQESTNSTSVESVEQESTNSTVSVNDSVTVNVSDIKKEKKELFIIFWDKYHSITNQPKTDRDPSLKYWDKLSIEEMQKAIDNIQPYYDNIKDYGKGKMTKKARTYLCDKNYNDEYSIKSSSEKVYPTYQDMLKKDWDGR